MRVEVYRSGHTGGFLSTFVKDLSELSNSISLIAKTKEERLFVRFANGSEYVYCNVRDNTLDEILSSASIGKAFRNEVINNPDRYPYSDVSALTENEIKMLGLFGRESATFSDSILEESRSALTALASSPLF